MKTFYTYSSILMVLFFAIINSAFGQLTYKSTWVANTGGTWKTFTQMYILGAGVSQAGTTAGVTNWDEGGRGLGLYNSDGNVVNTEWNDRGAGTMVAINKKFVYNSWGDAIEKRPVTKTTQSLKRVSLSGITGVSANDLFVVATLYHENKVMVYNADLTLLRTIKVNRPAYATPDDNGNIWVIQRTDNGPQVIELDASGVATGKVITGFSDPVSLQVSKLGQLIVGDNGVKQVFFYDITGTPTLAKTFGQKGGIGAGIPGEVKPDKFNGITYAGTDSLNNLYVISNREGAIIRKFNPAGEQVWQKYGLAFVDMATMDPENENIIYSQEEKYVMDYSKENGQEATYAACLRDDDKYPEDPRANQSLDGGVWIKYINGKKFMFVGNMYSDFIFIYRFNFATDGEIAIPCGAIMNHTSQQWGSVEWPAHQPKLGSYIWRDKNGNGKFEADEYESNPNQISLANVDDKANVYLAGSLDYFECMGLDEIGNPIYSFKNKVTQAIPQEFYLFKKSVYDNKRDVMYMSGNSNSLGNDKNLGPVFAAYPNWSKGNRKPLWVKEHPADYTSIGAKSDYVFLGLELDNSNIDVLDAKTGAMVGTFEPQQLLRFGWIDIPWGIMAEQRANGEYLVFREDDYVAKTVIQRWNPYSNDAENPTKPMNIQLVSKTSTSATVSYNSATDITGLSGYFIYANGVRNNKLTVWDTKYTLTGLLPDTDYDITVAAADFAGHETNSDVVKVKTFPTDNTKPATTSGITASEISYTSFKLSWNAASDNIGTVGYNIFVNDQKIGYKLIEATTFTFTDLMPAQQYQIKLVAYDYAGNASDTSSVVSVTTLADAQAPTTPILYTTTLKSSSEIAVTWTASRDDVNVEYYNIFQNGSLLQEKIPAHEYMGIPVSGDQFFNYRITGLQHDSIYNLSVKGFDKSGNGSEFSNTVTIKTDSVWSRLLEIEEADMTKMGHRFFIGTDPSFNVSGFLSGMMKQQGYIEWTVDVPADTLYRFITHYGSMETFPFYMQIDVNGVKAQAFTLYKLPSMVTWFVYDDDPGYVVARLKAGKNLIRLWSYSEFAPNMDLVKIKIAAPFVSVSSVSLDTTNLSLFIKDTYQLKTTVLPLNADIKGVKYTSSTSAITVSATGLITAKKEGTATVTVTSTDGSKTATCIVTVKNTVGISDNTLNNLISIYPNPATDIVNIDLGNSSDNGAAMVQIVDLLGKQVFESVKVTQKPVLHINTSQFGKGIYIVNILKGSGTICKKLIIQ